MVSVALPREVQRPQDYASDGTDAIGFLQFWGVSPALDLLGDDQAVAFGPAAVGTSPGGMYQKKDDPEDLESQRLQEEIAAEMEGAVAAGQQLPEELPLPAGDEPLNILVAGGADIRHILKTVSRRNQTVAGRKLRFFVHERHHEVHARHMLLLQVINNTSMTIRERMEMFLSIFGNTLVREKDSMYVSEIAREFIEIVTDESSHPLTTLIDLTHLKFKDRDILQDVFAGWDQAVPFDIEALRDQRCRGYYRDRYDYRKNLMDWDYTTFIKQVAGIIHWYHYKEFCFSGVAFETRLASYNTPNRTLASYTEAKGSKGTTVQVRGFWGDIINSPYHCYGTTAHPGDKARLFKISGQLYKHTETDIAAFNVTALLNEMEHGQPYHLPAETPEEHVYPYASPLEYLSAADKKVIEVTEESSAKVLEPANQADQTAARSQRRSRRQKKTVEWPPLSPGFENVEVVLLGGNLGEALKKPKYEKLFHRAFIGTMATIPLLEELGLTAGGDDPFRVKDEIKRIIKPPRVERPEEFGTRSEQSSLAFSLAPGATAIFETMKYQAHFEAKPRLSFRHRVAQLCHLSGFSLIDERRAVPNIEFDMKDKRARMLEKDATDFLRFVAPA
jgi:dynein assembly factor 3